MKNEHLVIKAMPFAASMAMRFFRTCALPVDLDELTSAANYALVLSALRFNYKSEATEEIAFWCYSKPAVKAAMMNVFRKRYGRKSSTMRRFCELRDWHLPGASPERDVVNRATVAKALTAIEGGSRHEDIVKLILAGFEASEIMEQLGMKRSNYQFMRFYAIQKMREMLCPELGRECGAHGRHE